MNTNRQDTLQYPTEIPVGGHYRLWLLLGEVCAVLREVRETALTPREAAEVEEKYLLRCAQGIAVASGNTLTHKEIGDIAARAERGLLEETPREREIWNVVQACHGLTRATRQLSVPKYDTDYLGRINATVLDGLALPAGEEAGSVRRGEVEGIGLPAEKCRFALECYCSWVGSDTFAAENAEMQRMVDILRALMAHAYLLRIHPYPDGNARTARLAELFLLMAAGVPAPAAYLLGAHSSPACKRLVQALAAPDTAPDVAEWDQFFIHALEGWRDALRGLLADLREYRLRAAWRLHVEEYFRNSPTEKTGTRRRDLLLSLPSSPTPINAFPDIPQEVFYTHYRHKNLRTLSRDLAELVQCGLLEHTREGYRPKREGVMPWG
ncbi:MAG: Fic family protein [Akkermansia sp.]|nr:Fic family protein [Akkermansia sp.]